MANIVDKLGRLELRIEHLLRQARSAKREQDHAPLQRDLEALDAKYTEVEHKQRERREEEQRLARLRDLEEQALLEPAPIRDRYGSLDKNHISHPSIQHRVDLEHLRPELGTNVAFRARVHARRRISNKLVFLLLRHQGIRIQSLIAFEDGCISENMVRWVGHIPVESVILVSGVLRKPDAPVENATFHDIELHISNIYMISRPSVPLPYSTYLDEALQFQGHQDGSEQDSASFSPSYPNVSDHTRLDHRVLDLREASNQAIFRIKATICNVFRTFLDSHGFLEIHTPKLQAGATETGAAVFQVNYFGREAFLAQSPQQAKQLAICSDFGRVYEIGPIFRAENSNTHRHLTEFTGLDLEMVIEESYEETLNILDEMFKTLWKTIYSESGNQISAVEKRFPHEKLVWLEKTPRISFTEAVSMLRESGWTNETGQEQNDTDDLSTQAEIRLGEVVKEKYGTDYYILDKFPSAVRPFYTMPDSSNSRFTNSFDIMLRGQEIVSGGQRIHDQKSLESKMQRSGLQPETMTEYLEGFQLAAPPHAGAGIGLERVVTLLLCLGDVRWASLAPRDPKSFPTRPSLIRLRHPDANTLELALTPRLRNASVKVKPPPLEYLIANYGDAANTSWLDARFQVWRHNETGAAQGFVPVQSFLVIVGGPLCDPAQYPEVIDAFLQHVRAHNRHPIWILVGKRIEEILGQRYQWRTLTCCAESRAKLRDRSVLHDHAVVRKVRHAEREGVTIVVVNGEGISDDLRSQIDARVKDWLAQRKGKQVHLTEIEPWRDMEHRRYLYARDGAGSICALVVLHQLSIENGFQVKFALDFPGAPSGAIEAITLRAMDLAYDAGASTVTFGTTATERLAAVRNMNGPTSKALAKIYGSIARSFSLTRKGDFRQKLGAKEDPTYICFPRNGMGPKGMKALMDFFQSE